MPIDHMTLQAFLEDDHVARWTLNVNFDLGVDGLAMVFHVAPSLKSFAAAFAATDEVSLRLVDSLDVIPEVICTVRGE